MDMETARVMLQLLLGKHWPLFTQFAQFLDQSKYKVINKDQWCNILEFSRTINHDLSNYDLDGACKYNERNVFIYFIRCRYGFCDIIKVSIFFLLILEKNY